MNGRRIALLLLALAFVARSGFAQEGPAAEDVDLAVIVEAVREAMEEDLEEDRRPAAGRNPLALTWEWVADLSNGDTLSLIAVLLLLLDRIRPVQRHRGGNS